MIVHASIRYISFTPPPPAPCGKGDEDHIFNGDVNMHYTDVNALHMAAMAGHAKCVKPLGHDNRAGTALS